MSSSAEGGYSTAAVVISAICGLIVAVGSVWAVSVLWAGGDLILYEQLFRVGPTVEHGGIGSDWVTGNTITWLDFLIAITHAADVILGAFILFLLFVHWSAFRRLAGQMREPETERSAGAAATDGGRERSAAREAAEEPRGGERE